MHNKGSFTVEASIIFSFVFLLVAALVYFFIIMYQYVYLQSAANQAANLGAYYYVDQYGADTLKSTSNLYWRIIDTDSADKKSKINSFIAKKLERSIITSTRYVNNDTSYKFLLKQLEVNIEERYPLPIGDLFMIFGIAPILNLKAEAKFPLDDNAEFIRNLDMVIDIKSCILNSDNKWIGEESKLKDVLDKLLKKH